MPSAAAACSDSEIARVLVQQRWENRLRHQVADSLIAIGTGETLRVALHALPKTRILVFHLIQPGEKRRSEVHRIVEGIFGSDVEFALRRNRYERRRTVGRPVVG